MKQRSRPDTAVRVGALIAVTLLHLPFIVAKRSRERPAIDEAALLVRFVAANSSTIEPHRPLEQRGLPKATVSHQRRATSGPSTEPVIARSPDDHARVDWYLESATASAAAIDTIVRDESYRPLGPREKRFQIVEPKPGTPLFEEPKHRSGDIAPNPLGFDSVWHNERCFTQLAQPLIPHLPSAGGGDTNPVTCLFPLGTPEPRGDLFEHLKKKRDKAPLPGEKRPE